MSEKTSHDMIPNKPESPTESDERKTPQEVQDNIRLAELERGWRKIESSPWGTIRIYRDSIPFIQKQGEDAYAKKYGSLLEDSDCKTHSEIDRMLRKRKLWGDENEQAISNKLTEIQQLAKEIRDKQGKDKEEMEPGLKTLESEYIDLIMERTRLFWGSIEVRADVARRMALIFYALRKDPGKDEDEYKACESVWKSLEMMELDQNFGIAQAMCGRFWGGMEEGEDFFGELLAGVISRRDGNIVKKQASPSSKSAPQPN